jgi:hypothetical protein
MKRAIVVAGLLVSMATPFAHAQHQLFVGTWKADPYHSGATGKFDGVDVPVVATPARRAAFTYAFSRIDDHTWDIIIKVNGERRPLVHNVMSDDGETMKAVSTVINRNQVNQVVIYEKE